MTPPQILMARIAVATVFSASALVLASSRKLRNLPRPTFDRLVAVSFLVSRIGLFVLIFFVLRMPPRGDIHIYVEQAQWFLEGKLPYRDFVSAYAPLYPVMNAALLFVSKEGLGLMFWALLCECATFLLWLSRGREFFSDQQVRLAALLYLGSAISVQYVAIDGQNNSIAGLMVTAAVLLLARHKNLLSGFFLGLGISVVKFLPLIFAPIYFMVSPRRWLWVGGLALCCVPIYGWFALNHCPLLVRLVSEGTQRTSGNFPFVLEAVTGVGLPDRLYDGVVALALLTIMALVYQVARGASQEVRLRVLSFGLAAMIMAAVVFSKKSWPPYLILVLFPICLTVPARRIHAIVFAVFNIAACAEPSAWWLALSATGPQMHHYLIDKVPSALWFMPLDLVVVGGYFWLLALALRGITAGANAAELPASAEFAR